MINAFNCTGSYGCAFGVNFPFPLLFLERAPYHIIFSATPPPHFYFWGLQSTKVGLQKPNLNVVKLANWEIDQAVERCFVILLLIYHCWQNTIGQNSKNKYVILLCNFCCFIKRFYFFVFPLFVFKCFDSSCKSKL